MISTGHTISTGGGRRGNCCLQGSAEITAFVTPTARKAVAWMPWRSSKRQNRDLSRGNKDHMGACSRCWVIWGHRKSQDACVR